MLLIKQNHTSLLNSPPITLKCRDALHKIKVLVSGFLGLTLLKSRWRHYISIYFTTHLVAPRITFPRGGRRRWGSICFLYISLVSACSWPSGRLGSIVPHLHPRVLCYILEVCSWVKINVVNTPLWMNKFPRAAATPPPVVNKLIHGVIHSLKCSQPLFIPPIYVCCYFSESAERNHARGEINHISPFNLWRRAGVIWAHFYPRKHHRREAAKGNRRGKSGIFLHKPARGGRWLSSLHALFSVTMVGKGSGWRQSRGDHPGRVSFITVIHQQNRGGHFSATIDPSADDSQKHPRF